MQITCGLKETSGFRALLTVLLAERSNCRGLLKEEGPLSAGLPLTWARVVRSQKDREAQQRVPHITASTPTMCLLLPAVCFTHTPENGFGSYNQAP